MKFYLLLFLFVNSLLAEINLIKKENLDSNTTLLVIGGIHGDEPGGYFAASILATHYKIKSKNLWIIPNLNKKSVMQNTRGINGDMNRKFAVLKEDDPDKETIEEIKKIILKENVSLILNLHDGHGFYRKENQGNIFNPSAWGQTCVIDQCKLKEDQAFGDLDTIAAQVKENLNKKLIKSHHSFDVKNTKTKFEDEAMQLSLTYFAVTHNKPSFAIESSKNLSYLSEKVFYQLLAIEEFMKIMDINFEREFDFTQQEIEKIIDNYGYLTINNNILFKLNDIKNSLSYIPIESKNNLFHFTHPLAEVEENEREIHIYIGNKKLTKLKPQYFKVNENCPQTYNIEIDSLPTTIKKASYFSVKDNFKILDNEDLRVNVIGYSAKGITDEKAILLDINDMSENYSLDKKNKVYRVEFYKNDEFCTILMVEFQ